MEKRKFNIDELKKDNPFKVPEGYFEELPSIIQSRVTKPKNDPIWIMQPAVRWVAVAASVVIFALYFSLFRSDENAYNEVEGLIAQIETEELIAYLEYSDLTTDELLASVDFTDINFEELESEDQFFDDIDLNELESIDLFEAIDVSPELL